MKVVVIGLGSMGKRRIRLLKKYDETIVIYGIDSSEERQKEAYNLYGINICKDIEEAVSKGVTCAFVSTSPLAHASIIKNCLSNNLNVFTELNVVSDGYQENQTLAYQKNKVLFLSSTFLYRAEIKYIKKRVEEVGGKYAYFYHVGQWLPDWHPWESYKDFFVFDKRTNGVREILVRELPWLTETFGDIESWSIEMNTVSSLQINYPDSYYIIFNHCGGSKGVVLIDIVSRKSSINLEVISENLYLTWNGTPSGVYEFDIKTKEEIQVHLYDTFEHNDNYAKNIVEDAYSNEITAFFDQVLNGVIPSYGFTKDQRVLDIMDGLEAKLVK